MKRRDFIQLLGLTAAAAVIPLPDNAELLDVESLPVIAPAKQWIASNIIATASKPGPVYLYQGDALAASFTVPYQNAACDLPLSQRYFSIDPGIIRLEAPMEGLTLVNIQMVACDKGIKTIMELIDSLNSMQNRLLLTNKGHRFTY